MQVNENGLDDTL